METVIFEAPALYGDHHVSEARRILFEMPGVGEAYVSSAFQVIEVTFDPARIKAEQIEARLQEAGYLGAIRTPTEAGIAAQQAGDDAFFRHTAVYETVKGTVAFAQQVERAARPLWPCPGMGPGQIMEEE